MISGVASAAWKMNPGTAANSAVPANAVGIARSIRRSPRKTVASSRTVNTSDTSRWTKMLEVIHANAPWTSRCTPPLVNVGLATALVAGKGMPHAFMVLRRIHVSSASTVSNPAAATKTSRKPRITAA